MICAPAGGVTACDVTCVMRPPSTTTVAFGTGGRPVPSMSVTPRITTAPGACPATGASPVRATTKAAARTRSTRVVMVVNNLISMRLRVVRACRAKAPQARRRAASSAFLSFAIAAALLATPAALQGPYDIVIRNGRVLDGMGNPWILADVAIKDGGSSKSAASPARASVEIDARGRYVSPGWIDMMDQSGAVLPRRTASRRTSCAWA